MVAGAGLVGVIAVGWLRLRERWREARRERPPQSEKLLRPPGYSAGRRLDDLADKLAQPLMLAIFGGALLGLIVASFYPLVEGLLLSRFTLTQVRHAPGSELFLSAALVGMVGLLLTAGGFMRVWELEAEIRNWRLGLRGEQAVAEVLADRSLAKAGYVVFHDVPGAKDWNIDHVVVGPGGVFVLETKACSHRKPKWRQQANVVEYDGRILKFPWRRDDEVVPQVRRNAAWVGEFLAAFPPKDIPVQPVIVVPGWWAEAKGNYPVKVMPPKYLIGYLTGTKPLFTSEQLEPVIKRLDERCRTLEF